MPSSVTKFYCHAAPAILGSGIMPGTGGATVSTVSPDVTQTNANVNNSADGTVGVSQTSQALTTLAQTGLQRNWFARWVTGPLAAQAVPAGNWTAAFGFSESNLSSNLLPSLVVALWRPNLGAVVTYIVDPATQFGSEPGTTETGAAATTIAGAAFDPQAGDVLVFELWGQNTQASATAFTNTIFYDGTTDPTDGAGVASAASYVLAPSAITMADGMLLPQKLYLRHITPPDHPTSGTEQSVALPVGTSVLAPGNANEYALRERAPFGGDAADSGNSSATVSQQSQWMHRSSSPPLDAQAIPPGVWTLAVAYGETNANAESFTAASLYIWRPTGSLVVGFIYDSAVLLGSEWNLTELGQVVTFNGAGITVALGDVLVLEVWRIATQLSATAYLQSVWSGGDADVVNGLTTNAAAWLYGPAVTPFMPAATSALAW